MTTHMICSHCGSTDIYADATALWDNEQDEWVLGTVHDDRYCDQCGGETNLIEVDEAEGLEIGFYGMVKDGDEARLVQDHETPNYFDLMVRTTALESGEILTLYEFDGLTRKEANTRMMFFIALFPTTPIDWHLGKQPEYTPRGNYYDVTREQWDVHKANAPEIYNDDDVSDQFVDERDWQYFRRPSSGHYSWTRYAMCPTTGVIRYPNLAEYCNVFGRDGW